MLRVQRFYLYFARESSTGLSPPSVCPASWLPRRVPTKKHGLVQQVPEGRCVVVGHPSSPDPCVCILAVCLGARGQHPCSLQPPFRSRRRSDRRAKVNDPRTLDPGAGSLLHSLVCVLCGLEKNHGQPSCVSLDTRRTTIVSLPVVAAFAPSAFFST